jgi:hypothetical protein
MKRKSKKNESRQMVQSNGGALRPKYGSGGPQTVVVVPGPYYMPEKLFHTMTYTSDWHETTAGGFIDWVYRGNSIWDPQFAVGGESAYGEAAMAGIYLYWKVLSSRITVIYGNEDADTVTIAIVPTALSTSLTDKEDITAMPRCKYALSNAGAAPARVVNSMATAPMLGMQGYDENGLTGVHASGDPTNVWFWHVVFSNTTAQAFNGHVRLKEEFDVMEYGLKTAEQ